MLSRTHLPFATSIPTTSSSYYTVLEHPNLDLLDVGHCLGTTSCRASPRHELHLRYLVSFRDVRHLSLFHNVYYQQSSRSSLWSYCWFISLNCTCVVSTAFGIFPGARHLAVTLSAAQLGCSPLRRMAGTWICSVSTVRCCTQTAGTCSHGHSDLVNWTSGICAVF